MLDVVFANDEELTAEQKSDIFKNEYNINDATFEKEVTDLNAYVLDYANKYANKIVAKNNLDWQIKLDEVIARAEAEAKAKAEAEAKAAKEKAEAAKKDKLAQKLLGAKRYVDLENMYKDAELQKKLYAEFGIV